MITMFLGLFGPLIVYLWCNHWTILGPDTFGYLPDRGDIVMGLIVGLLATAGTTLLAGMIAFGLGEGTGEEYRDLEPYHKGKMVSLRSADGVAGSLSGGLFMIHGSIGSKQYYHWYEAREDGGFEPHDLKVGAGTYVYEQDRDDGEVLIWHWHKRRPSWMMLIALYDDHESTGKTYKFYIPKGSIQRTFKLQ